MRLQNLLENSADQFGDKTAVIDPERNADISYRDFNGVADRVSQCLRTAGVVRGDRVGIYSPKSIPSLTAVFGALKSDAAYVPVDPDAPASRNAFIFGDCGVQSAIVAAPLLDGLQDEHPALDLEVVDALDDLSAYGVDLVIAKNVADRGSISSEEELAYILYTSGSTGRPKGVVHTHASAMSFVDWCSDTFEPVPEDRFSSHAPFHFDLSILDIYVPIKHGATLVLFGESLGKQPKLLGPAISEYEISMWYSTPSILRLLIEYGDIDQHDYSTLRVVNFAGEVFPLKHLRALKEIWPHPRYFNLYGPTETNVCTWYEVKPDVPLEVLDALPIGTVCSNDRAKVVDVSGAEVADGDDGELLISGGSVMVGYWNAPDKTSKAFEIDDQGGRWYHTGDVVQKDTEGNFLFLGRRDRMVKRRGYRVELGEIEAALYRHSSIKEAGVVAVPDDESGVIITAYLNWNGEERGSQIRMKQFCAENLPLYMVPDRFAFMGTLPKTSTDKIDYQRLKAQSA